MAQRVAAAYSLFYRLAKDYEKPEFGIRKVDVDGVEVAIDERIEMDKPFCSLVRFKRFSDDPATLAKLKGQPPVLVVAPLSGHYATPKLSKENRCDLHPRWSRDGRQVCIDSVHEHQRQMYVLDVSGIVG